MLQFITSGSVTVIRPKSLNKTELLLRPGIASTFSHCGVSTIPVIELDSTAKGHGKPATNHLVCNQGIR